MNSPSADFRTRGYAVLRNLLPDDVLAVLYRYCAGYAKRGDARSDDLVPGAPAGYAHPCMEMLLQKLLSRVEAVSGKSVYPTYSYFRVYRHGDALLPHRDRPACEISVSLCLGLTGADEWPLWFKAPDGDVAVSMRPGDGVAYHGIETTHWRDPFAGTSAAQVFLHYVDRSGPHAEWRFDKRPALRLSAL